VPLHFAHSRLLHTMLRVTDLERSIAFYVGQLGMRVLRRRDHPQGRFTLAFLGYADEDEATALELTHNWGTHTYQKGTAFGHIAIAVPDLKNACQALDHAGVPIVRPPGPLREDPSEWIAFVEDPDGHRIELIQRKTTRPAA
jgi:lactoylglutathione lyase